MNAVHVLRKSHVPMTHYRSKSRKKRLSQIMLSPASDHPNYSVEGGGDVFSLTDIQGKPLSAATRMMSPITPGKRILSPQMKTSGLEYPSIRSTGPQSIGSNLNRQIHSGIDKKLSGDMFQISLETQGEENKRNLIQLRKIPQRMPKFSTTTVGSMRSMSHDGAKVEKFEQERTKHLKPDFHQAINLDIQFLRAKFRNYQRDLFKNTSHKLSPDNKLNFKKVLNKIRDMSQMSYQRQKQQVKMRRKFRYPFLKHEEESTPKPLLHPDHKHETKENTKEAP